MPFYLTQSNNSHIITIEIEFQYLFKKAMLTSTATKLLPIVSDDKKVEVSLEADQAFIKLSTWVEDLGWCGQKTLQIDTDMLDDLHRAIASARYKVNKEKIENDDKPTSSKVIEFPSCS